MLAWETVIFHLPSCPPSSLSACHVENWGTAVISVTNKMKVKNALLLCFFFFFLSTDFSLYQLVDWHGRMKGQNLPKPVQGVSGLPRLRAAEEIRASSSGQEIFLSCLELKQLLCILDAHPSDMLNGRKRTCSAWFVFRTDWQIFTLQK